MYVFFCKQKTAYERRIIDWGSDVCSSDLDVVPRALHNLEVLAKKYFKVEPLIVGESSAPWRITLDVEEPGTVGADWVVNAIAAHHLYPGDLIIIDFGTASPYDVIDYSGAYQGGIITPCIQIGRSDVCTPIPNSPVVFHSLLE